MQVNQQQNLKSFFENRHVRDHDVWSFHDLNAEPAKILFRHVLSENKWIDFDGRTLLNIGCGLGRDLVRFTKMGGEGIGVDLDSCLDWKEFSEFYPIQFVKSDFKSWKDSGKFDLILDSTGIHHRNTDDFCLFLKKLREFMKPQSIAATCIYAFDSYMDENGDLVRQKLEDLFRSCWLEPVRFVKVNSNGSAQNQWMVLFRLPTFRLYSGKGLI
jgi:SAM-dependent methyltransferase